MKLNTLAQPWQVQKEANTRLNLAPSPRFVWMHHPQNWELISFKQPTEKRTKTIHLLLPVFTTLVITDGVNEVRSNGKRADDSVAKAQYRNRGLKILEPTEFDYLVGYPAKGGTYYTDKFEVLEQVGRVVVKSYDYDSFTTFRRELMKKKVFDLPHPHFIRLMMIDNRRSIDKYIKDQHIPENAVKLAKHQNIDKLLKDSIKNIESKGYSLYE